MKLLQVISQQIPQLYIRMVAGSHASITILA